MVGHIKIDRKILNWEWYQDLKVFHLFLYLLLKANHKDGNWKGINIKRGDVIIGRLKCSKDTGLTENEIRTCLKKLKLTNEITTKPTNKYTVVTICKYDFYQSNNFTNNQEINQQTEQSATNKSPTNHQQLTTNNNSNNKEEIKNNIKKEEFSKNLDFVCYDVEEYVLGNQKLFEKICIATGKNSEEVKTQLHLYHLWMAKKEQYPLGKKAAAAGIESWILNSNNFKPKTNGTGIKQVDTTTKFNAGALELLEKGKRVYDDIRRKQDN